MVSTIYCGACDLVPFCSSDPIASGNRALPWSQEKTIRDPHIGEWGVVTRFIGWEIRDFPQVPGVSSTTRWLSSVLLPKKSWVCLWAPGGSVCRPVMPTPWNLLFSMVSALVRRRLSLCSQLPPGPQACAWSHTAAREHKWMGEWMNKNLLSIFLNLQPNIFYYFFF